MTRIYYSDFEFFFPFDVRITSRINRREHVFFFLYLRPFFNDEVTATRYLFALLFLQQDDKLTVVVL